MCRDIKKHRQHGVDGGSIASLQHKGNIMKNQTLVNSQLLVLLTRLMMHNQMNENLQNALIDLGVEIFMVKNQRRVTGVLD